MSSYTVMSTAEVQTLELTLFLSALGVIFEVRYRIQSNEFFLKLFTLFSLIS